MEPSGNRASNTNPFSPSHIADKADCSENAEENSKSTRERIGAVVLLASILLSTTAAQTLMQSTSPNVTLRLQQPE